MQLGWLRGNVRDLGLLQGISALVTELGIGSVIFVHAVWADLGGDVFVWFGEFGGDDACGDDDHGVADEDDDGGEEFAEGCFGCDVAVADGGHGDDGPIHGLWYGGEA